jgi:signal peptidase II
VIFVAIFLCTTGFDQGSKQWAKTLPTHPADCDVPADMVARHCAGVPQPLIHGVWDWELAMNDGIAFSTFAGGNGQIILSIIAAIALIAIGIAAARTKPGEHLKRVGLAMIAGGALGNLIDRVRDGAVTDFIRWRAGDHLWPIFNVADAALVIGVGLLLIESALAKRRRAMLEA